MSDIVIGENTQIDISTPMVEIISPRDPRYAIQFFVDTINNKLAQADAFTESVYKAVIKEASTASQIAQSFKKGSRFVVDMTDATKEAIDKGHLKLVFRIEWIV